MNKTDLITAFEQSSFLYGGNAQFIEGLYAKYLENPAAVDVHWRQFFAGLDDDPASAKQQVSGPSWARKDWPPTPTGDLVSAFDGNWTAVEKVVSTKIEAKAKETGKGLSVDEVRKATMDSVRALMMIRAFRMRGHLAADLDPLKLAERPAQPELDPATYGLTIWDLDREFLTGGREGIYAAVGGSSRSMKLGEILGVLRDAGGCTDNALARRWQWESLSLLAPSHYSTCVSSAKRV